MNCFLLNLFEGKTQSTLYKDSGRTAL